LLKLIAQQECQSHKQLLPGDGRQGIPLGIENVNLVDPKGSWGKGDRAASAVRDFYLNVSIGKYL
jgi:hypothetical protein